MSKLKIWNEEEWDRGAKKCAQKLPLKVPRHMPNMIPIAESGIKWKGLVYLIRHDKEKIIKRYLLKHPLRYATRLLASLCKKKSYTRDRDFFFYNLKDATEFIQLANHPQALIVVGFSYCHKPLECPSGRFSTECIHDPEHPVCRQCFIGKAVNALPEKAVIPLFITTIHYIGGTLLELQDQHPDKKLLFLITACEMTLEMFGDFGNMIRVPGIGVRLDGRICNTMRAFDLSEKGIKPGLTIVREETQSRMLELIAALRDAKK